MRCFLLLLLFCLSANAALAQHGVGPLWSTAVALPKASPDADQRGTLYNNIVVTSTGRIIVATEEYHPVTGVPTGVYLTTSDDEGQTWSAPMLVAPIDMLIGGASPKLALDSDDNLYILFSAKQPAGLYCCKYDSDLNLLIDTVQVAPSFHYTNWAAHLTVDAQDRLHVIWHEGNHKVGEQSECYHARSLDGGLSWSTPVMVSTDDGRASAFPRAQYDAVHDDHLAIVWRDSVGPQNWDILMATSTDGGATWSAPQLVVQSPHNDSDPDLVIDPQGRWHLFFHRYPQGDPFFGAAVWYGHSDDGGQTWAPAGWRRLSVEGKRSHLTEGDRYDETTGRLWCMWKDERDGPSSPDIMLSYSTDGGATWSEPEFASDEGSQPVGYKAMALFPDGRLALNYEVALPDGLQVYFRQRELETTTATTSATAAPSWTLAPNPAREATWIELPDAMQRTVQLYDLNGRLLTTRAVAQPTFRLDLSDFPAGIYVVSIPDLGAARLVVLPH